MIGDSLACSGIPPIVEFGFTIGAPQAILESIARITESKNRKLRGKACKEEVESFLVSELLHLGQHFVVSELDLDLSILREVQSVVAKEYLEAEYQEQAFIQATHIYLYRSLLNVPPETLASYVGKTLTYVSAFAATSSGNFSIWPAFIAAVEAFTEDHLVLAKEWLDWATSFGIGSRDSMKLVVEEVWRQRDKKSESSGLSKGLIIIDWREVMHQLDSEVLLI